MSVTQGETSNEHLFFPESPQKCKTLRFSKEFCALPWPKKIPAYFGFTEIELFERVPLEDDGAEVDETLEDDAAASAQEYDYEDDLE